MLRFWKTCGSGNDFIVLDNRDGSYPTETLSSWSQVLCRRRTCVGADGVLVIEGARDRGSDFRMRLFNPDGSEGEMCGNGARCAARWFYEKGSRGQRDIRFETLSGPVEATVLKNGDVRLLMPPPSEIEERKIVIDGKERTVHFVTVGVPHTVVFTPGLFDTDSGEICRIGREVRHDGQFKKGTNVNFTELGQGELMVRTYERGVEEETLACGTGSTASALVYHRLNLVEFPVTVRTRGGVLRVAREEDGIYLTGDVRLVYHGEIDEKVLETEV